MMNPKLIWLSVADLVLDEMTCVMWVNLPLMSMLVNRSAHIWCVWQKTTFKHSDWVCWWCHSEPVCAAVIRGGVTTSTPTWPNREQGSAVNHHTAGLWSGVSFTSLSCPEQKAVCELTSHILWSSWRLKLLPYWTAALRLRGITDISLKLDNYWLPWAEHSDEPTQFGFHSSFSLCST